MSGCFHNDQVITVQAYVDSPGMSRTFVPIPDLAEARGPKTRTMLILYRDINHVRISGHTNRLPLVDLIQFLNQLPGTFYKIKFQHIAEWDYGFNQILGSVIQRTEVLWFQDIHDSFYNSLHMAVHNGNLSVKELVLNTGTRMTVENSEMLFVTLSQMKVLQSFVLDGDFTGLGASKDSEVVSKLCQTLRGMVDLQHFGIEGKAFSHFGISHGLVEVFLAAACGARVFELSARPSQANEKQNRRIPFSAMADITCNHGTTNLRSIHWKNVHVSPNHNGDQRICVQLTTLDVEKMYGNEYKYLNTGTLDTLRLFPYLLVLRMTRCYINNIVPFVEYLRKEDCVLEELVLDENQIGIRSLRDIMSQWSKVFNLRNLDILNLKDNPCQHCMNKDDEARYERILKDSNLSDFVFRSHVVVADNNQQVTTFPKSECYGEHKVFHFTSFLCCNQMRNMLKKEQEIDPRLWSTILEKADRMRWSDHFRPLKYLGRETAFYLSSHECTVLADRASVIFTLITEWLAPRSLGPFQKPYPLVDTKPEIVRSRYIKNIIDESQEDIGLRMLEEYEAITHDDIMVRHGLEYRATHTNIALDLKNDMDAAANCSRPSKKRSLSSVQAID